MKSKTGMVKIIFTTVLVSVFALLLILIKGNPILGITFLSEETLNAAINYQITVLGLAGLMILYVLFVFGKEVIRLLNVIHLDGIIIPERMIGINPKKNETWKNLGLNFTGFVKQLCGRDNFSI